MTNSFTFDFLSLCNLNLFRVYWGFWSLQRFAFLRYRRGRMFVLVCFSGAPLKPKALVSMLRTSSTFTLFYAYVRRVFLRLHFFFPAPVTGAYPILYLLYLFIYQRRHTSERISHSTIKRFCLPDLCYRVVGWVDIGGVSSLSLCSS